MYAAFSGQGRPPGECDLTTAAPSPVCHSAWLLSCLIPLIGYLFFHCHCSELTPEEETLLNLQIIKTWVSELPFGVLKALGMRSRNLF